MKKEKSIIGLAGWGVLMSALVLTVPAVHAFGGNFEGDQGERVGFRAQIERNIENISNGVQITITSENEEIVDRLQSREMKAPRHEEVEKTQVNIDNGVKVTVTSNDPELVEKIQSHHENMGKKGFRKRGKRASRGGFRGHRGFQAEQEVQ